MTEITETITKYTCNQCNDLLFELRRKDDKTSYGIEYICGNCGKYHRIGYASSSTPMTW